MYHFKNFWTNHDVGCSVLAVAYPGFQREGCLRSGPIQKVGGGGGGHSASILAASLETANEVAALGGTTFGFLEVF